MTTVYDALQRLQGGHRAYIQATYHINDPRLIEERRLLLQEPFGVFATPWLEGLPPYQGQHPITDLRIPAPCKKILWDLAAKGTPLLPSLYTHQRRALEAFLGEDKDLVVATGTGSGKTEIFLYSVAGHLAKEAERNKTTATRAIRCLILYPMNALVSDQLGRLRHFLGDESPKSVFAEWFGRPVQFGMYTSRTPYPGRRLAGRDRNRLRPRLQYYRDYRDDPERAEIFDALERRGKVPKKDIDAFLDGTPTQQMYRTGPNDAELYTRQEMQERAGPGGTPDVLITNYSMLEYMLLRPIEDSFFSDTATWLDEDDKNQLIVVLDEAHLYRGAQGAEVALLLQRLRHRLNAAGRKIRFILTSASLANDGPHGGVQFAHQLTASPANQFVLVEAQRIAHGRDGRLNPRLKDALAGLDASVRLEDVRRLAATFGWTVPQLTPANWPDWLGAQLHASQDYQVFHDAARVLRQPAELARNLFGDDSEQSQRAVLGFATLVSAARHEGKPLLPMRLHLMARGLPSQYVCLNPRCSAKRAPGDFLGRMYLGSRQACECGGRVFELLTHRDCGAAYLRAYYGGEVDAVDPTLLWDDKGTTTLREVHLLLTPPRDDPAYLAANADAMPAIPCYLHTRSGLLFPNPPPRLANEFIPVWWPPEPAQGSQLAEERHQTENGRWLWQDCQACGQQARLFGEPSIMDLETKGEDPFANLLRGLFQLQPSQSRGPGDFYSKLPNQGRKILAFADSRQKAARLARDLQRTVQLDTFREILTSVASRGTGAMRLDAFYPTLVAEALRLNIGLFDDAEADEEGAHGSRTRFAEDKGLLIREAQAEGVPEGDLIRHGEFVQQLNRDRPAQFDQAWLRILGVRHFNVQATMTGYIRPVPEVLAALQRSTQNHPLTEAMVQVLIEAMLEERAFDQAVQNGDRARSRASLRQPQGRPRSGGEGLSQDDLADILERRFEGVPDATRAGLVSALQRMMTGLLETRDGRYYLRADKLEFILGTRASWFLCSACHKVAPFTVDGECSIAACRGETRSITLDDPYVQARKGFFLAPLAEVLAGTRSPFTMRSEEHTAQLGHVEDDEPFGLAEKYELLFQDILVEGTADEQPVDVLSCTTTMEVGIDIGTLTAVALRTVPPRADNYQQRSGRAGRRGAAISTILTYADNQPYEGHVFVNPDMIIGRAAARPILYVDNFKIAQRHINAVLVQQFFRQALRNPSRDSSSVFESLGPATQFFLGNGPFSLPAFGEWLDRAVLSNPGGLADEIAAMLPTGLQWDGDKTAANWRRRVVLQQATAFQQQLVTMAVPAIWETDDSSLLDVLLAQAMLPTFSFPLDVCSFTVQALNPSTRRIKTLYEPKQNLGVALSEYTPGKEVVIDKKTFVSYGAAKIFSPDPVDRLADEPWSGLSWLNVCRLCHTVLDSRDASVAGLSIRCPSCGRSEWNSLQVFEPKGFAPANRAFQDKPRQNTRGDDDVPMASPASFPVPQQARPPSHPPTLRLNHRVEVHLLRNEQLLMHNLGRRDGDRALGFQICTSCGAMSLEGPLAQSHERPYPLPIRRGVQRPARCEGATQQVALGYAFRTDLAVLRVEVGEEFNWDPGNDWFYSALASFTEALTLAAARVLSIESGEMAGNYRFFQTQERGRTVGHLEFFLHDTTPGGAGFATMAAERMDAVLPALQEILENCDCTSSCLSCIRTARNKWQHDSLNRHQALMIYDYAVDGRVGGLRPTYESALRQRILAAWQVLTTVGMPPQPPAFSLIPVAARQVATQGIPITDVAAREELPAVIARLSQVVARAAR